MNPADGREYELSFPVDLAGLGGGARRLYMDAGEPPAAAARRFLAEAGPLPGDPADLQRQLEEFVELNAPKTALEDVYRPDNAARHDYAPAAARAAPAAPRPPWYAAARPRRTARATAERAFARISGRFGGRGFDEACRALEPRRAWVDALGLAPEDAAALLCVAAHALECGCVAAEAADYEFTEYLWERLAGGSEGDAVFAVRCLAYLAAEPAMEATVAAAAAPHAAAAAARLAGLAGNADAAFLVGRLLAAGGDALGPETAALEELFRAE